MRSETGCSHPAWAMGCLMEIATDDVVRIRIPEYGWEGCAWDSSYIGSPSSTTERCLVWPSGWSRNSIHSKDRNTTKDLIVNRRPCSLGWLTWAMGMATERKTENHRDRNRAYYTDAIVLNEPNA